MKNLSLTILAITILSSIGYCQKPTLIVNNSSLVNKSNLFEASATQQNFSLSQNTGTVSNYRNKINLQQTPVYNDKTQLHLSALWTAVTLEIIIADVLSLNIPESNEEFTEMARGKEKEIMLGGAVAYIIPVSMVYLSHVLPYKANRIANLTAAGLTTVWVVAGASWNEPSYVVCLGAELAALSLITWKTLKWKDPEDKKHTFALDIKPGKNTYGLQYAYRF